jgi:hypothetical protein
LPAHGSKNWPTDSEAYAKNSLSLARILLLTVGQEAPLRRVAAWSWLESLKKLTA